MIKKIGNTVKKHKLLFENFISLSVLQAAGYILPLITLPYLVRVMGPDKFGLVAFAQSFVIYFTIITDYGFNLSATKDISVNRDNPGKVSEIFCSVYAVKLILLVFSTALFTALVFFIPRFRADYQVFMLSFIIVLGNTLFPVWIFQGMEKMKYITIINVIIKALFVIPVFIFIKKQQDYVYSPLINSSGFLVSGIIGFYLAVKIFRIKLIIPTATQIAGQFRDGWYIFVSTIAISVYTVSNTFILGLFANNTVVGYYSAAEKIVKAVQGILGPVSQAVYPHISRLVSESKSMAMAFLKKLLLVIGSGTFLLSAALFVFADPIVTLVLGPEYGRSVMILRILAFLPFIIGLSNVFGILGLMNFGEQKKFSRVILSGGIISLVLTIALVPMYKGIGSAVSWLITEMFITLSFLYYFSRLGSEI
jgi:PST family polysaccharide transporter